jgi:hypothetical protein
MRLAAFLFLIIAFAGCTKKTDVFVFDCVVFDQKVNAPVVGANVTMSVQRAVGGFNPNFENVGAATTDGNGRFTIEIDKDVFYSFRIDVSDSQHFSGVFDINPDNVPFSTAYSATFNLEPKSWIKTHVLKPSFFRLMQKRMNAPIAVLMATLLFRVFLSIQFLNVRFTENSKLA